MPTDARTSNHLLADVLLGDEQGPLERFVTDRRGEGRSWRLIARDLFDATEGKVDVTFETLRSWFPDVDKTPANARATGGGGRRGAGSEASAPRPAVPGAREVRS